MSFGTKRKYYVSESESSEEDEGRYSARVCNESIPDLKQLDNVALKPVKRRARCFSKNAVIARQNRLKKKLYIESLEDANFKLKSENKKLLFRLKNQTNVMMHLEREVKYLKSILANSSDISRLLKSICTSAGLMPEDAQKAPGAIHQSVLKSTRDVSV